MQQLLAQLFPRLLHVAAVRTSSARLGEHNLRTFLASSVTLRAHLPVLDVLQYCDAPLDTR